MAKASTGHKESLLDIYPEKVIFTYDASGISTAELKLTNKTNEWIVFKVKTNSPDNYLVKPCQGQISAKGEAQVKITVRGELVKQQTPSPRGHRFLIEYAKVLNEVNDTTSIWQSPGIETRSNRLQVSFRKKGGDESVLSSSGKPDSFIIEESKKFEQSKFSNENNAAATERSGEALGENMEQYKHLYEAMNIEYKQLEQKCEKLRNELDEQCISPSKETVNDWKKLLGLKNGLKWIHLAIMAIIAFYFGSYIKNKYFVAN